MSFTLVFGRRLRGRSCRRRGGRGCLLLGRYRRGRGRLLLEHGEFGLSVRRVEAEGLLVSLRLARRVEELEVELLAQAPAPLLVGAVEVSSPERLPRLLETEPVDDQPVSVSSTLLPKFHHGLPLLVHNVNGTVDCRVGVEERVHVHAEDVAGGDEVRPDRNALSADHLGAVLHGGDLDGHAALDLVDDVDHAAGHAEGARQVLVTDL
ncbi:hypothetical protein PHYPSEUDO_000485 [Phytophthora pseudosyringae]|uniref:Uncharacterized protein n=1 Tax=Phytophthora pseudosyringae TaxID=221518 RepID=A0A8T1VYL7_9STRA|nr:hypothetical protein PHYPSEUDO_000485 [Phytophthora pseudosyringae]